MRSSRRALLALVAAAALAPGCGDDAAAENAYVREVQAAQRGYLLAFERVRGRLGVTSTLAQDRATLAEFGKATGGFAAALREVEPPSAVAEEHRALIAAVLAYQSRVQRTNAGLAGGTTAARARVRTDLSSGVEATRTQLAGAVARINAGLRG